MAALSILDLVRVTENTDARGALDNARDLAAHAENWGYRRFWVAEHHNMPGIASAATSVVIAHIAAGSKTIRVGAGGIMLPNHAPIVIAEQFGTLARLFPGRIDLGLGRAPGTDPLTVQALRRPPVAVDTFPQDVLELQAYFAPVAPGQRCAGRAGCRNQRATVDSRVEHLRRVPGGGARTSLRVRIAFRAGAIAAGARHLSQPLQTVRAARTPPRDGGR